MIFRSFDHTSPCCHALQKPPKELCFMLWQRSSAGFLWRNPGGPGAPKDVMEIAKIQWTWNSMVEYNGHSMTCLNLFDQLGIFIDWFFFNDQCWEYKMNISCGDPGFCRCKHWFSRRIMGESTSQSGEPQKKSPKKLFVCRKYQSMMFVGEIHGF